MGLRPDGRGRRHAPAVHPAVPLTARHERFGHRPRPRRVCPRGAGRRAGMGLPGGPPGQPGAPPGDGHGRVSGSGRADRGARKRGRAGCDDRGPHDRPLAARPARSDHAAQASPDQSHRLRPHPPAHERGLGRVGRGVGRALPGPGDAPDPTPVRAALAAPRDVGVEAAEAGGRGSAAGHRQLAASRAQDPGRAGRVPRQLSPAGHIACGHAELPHPADQRPGRGSAARRSCRGLPGVD